jgi:hypothetical protein
MARLIGSFLVRLWRTTRSQRIEIEHIQSGEKELVASVAEAVEWITVHAGAVEPATPTQIRETRDVGIDGDAGDTETDKRSQ